MKTQVVSRPYKADGEVNEAHVTMKKEMFGRFFGVLKVGGNGVLRVQDGERCELEYYC